MLIFYSSFLTDLLSFSSVFYFLQVLGANVPLLRKKERNGNVLFYSAFISITRKDETRRDDNIKIDHLNK